MTLHSLKFLNLKCNHKFVLTNFHKNERIKSTTIMNKNEQKFKIQIWEPKLTKTVSKFLIQTIK